MFEKDRAYYKMTLEHPFRVPGKYIVSLMDTWVADGTFMAKVLTFLSIPLDWHDSFGHKVRRWKYYVLGNLLVFITVIPIAILSASVLVFVVAPLFLTAWLYLLFGAFRDRRKALMMILSLD